MSDPTGSALRANASAAQSPVLGEGELLPCPFCGEQPVTERTGFGLRAMYIYCNNAEDACPRPKAVGESEEAAIRNWNLRYPGAGAEPMISEALHERGAVGRTADSISATGATWLAGQLETLCCAETEGAFFDSVTENISTIIAGLRSAARLEADNARLREDNARLERNRDMWKGQVERQAARLTVVHEALTDIGVYACGMLNQPAAMNGPEEDWLRKRIARYESVARAALQQGDQP